MFFGKTLVIHSLTQTLSEPKLFIVTLYAHSSTVPVRLLLRWKNWDKIVNKKLRYREEHSASVVLSWCTCDISREKICWWLISHFYVMGPESYQIRRNNAK